MTAVERFDLAPGLDCSRVLTGLWQVADMERDGTALDPDPAADAMRAYVESGLTTFDMADHYGSAEAIAGAYRDRYGGADTQFCTKWVPQPGPVSRADVRTAVHRALDRMRSDTLDLLQFHAWSYPDPRWLDCMFWLQELVDEGLIRHLGLTNFDTAHLRVLLASGVQVASNQVCYSLIDQRARGEMTRLCLDHGVQLLAFGTVAGGLLTERWLEQPDVAPNAMATWSQMKYRRFIEEAGGWARFQTLLRTVSGIAGKHDVPMASVACRYMLDQPAVGGIIIGARLGQSEHIADTVRLFEWSLDDEDRAAIRSATEALDPIPGDCGDEYRRSPLLTASGDLSHHFDAFPPAYPVQSGGTGRTRASSGTIWEDVAGFSRAIRDGDRVFVSGTTATHGDRLIGGSDPAAQTHFIIDKIEGVLQSLGGSLDDIVRTRIYLQHPEHWEPVSRAHGQRFRSIRPANTLVGAALIGGEYLVEMEADAVLTGTGEQRS